MTPRAKQGRHMLTIADLTALYKISRTTIYRRMKDGTLPFYRLGPQSVRIDPREAAKAFKAVKPR